MAWYKNGQVTVQSGSRTVLGVGTAWLTQVLPGEGLDVLDGRLQEIAEVISNTELLLVEAYAGAAAVGVAYQIVPSASMTKELTRRVNALIATHEQMTADVGQAYTSTLENAAKVAAVTEQVEGDAQAAAASAQSASQSQAAAHADSDAAMGYRNEARAARDGAATEAAAAAQAKNGAQLAVQQAQVARDAAADYAQSIDPLALRDRANHTGTQSIETIGGLSDALEALEGVAAKAVQQTSATGAAVLPEGPPEDRPDPVPEVGLLVRLNSTSGKPEWYSRSKSSWLDFGGDITPVADDVGNLQNWRAAIAKGIPQDLIINGDMAISWRGTSWAGVTASNSAYFIDQWTHIQAASSAVVTIAQVADAAFGVNTQTLRYTVTTADASATAGHVVALLQKIEGYRISKLVSKPFVLRFKVRSPKAGKHCIALKNTGGDRSYIAEYTVNAANTVEDKVLLLPGLPTDGTWNFDTGMGLAVGFTLKCGATYQAPAGAWQPGDYWGSAGAANVCDTVGNVFAITDVHLHEGDANTPYVKRTRDEEQRLCARYLPVLFSNLQSYGSVVATGNAVGASLAIVMAKLSTPARTKPTGVTLQGSITISATQGNPIPLTSITVDQASSVDVVTFQANVASGLVAGQGTYCITTGNVLLLGCTL